METRRMVVYINNEEEKRNAMMILRKNPDLFVWCEKDEEKEKIMEVKNNIKQYSYCFIRKGCNALFSDKLTEVFH